jgi:hypothetical protein
VYICIYIHRILQNSCMEFNVLLTKIVVVHVNKTHENFSMECEMYEYGR